MACDERWTRARNRQGTRAECVWPVYGLAAGNRPSDGARHRRCVTEPFPIAVVPERRRNRGGDRRGDVASLPRRPGQNPAVPPGKMVWLRARRSPDPTFGGWGQGCVLGGLSPPL